MKKIYAILFALLLSSQLWSQRASDWQQQFDSNIMDMVIDPITGYVIVETSSGVSAIDPSNKEILWNHTKSELGFDKLRVNLASEIKLDPSNFNGNLHIELIPDTSLFLLKKGGNFVIIDLLTGELKLSTAEMKVFLLSKTNIPSKNIMLAMVQDGTNVSVVSFDTKAMKTIWSKPLGSDGIKGLFTNGLSEENPEPRIDKNGNFLLCFNHTLFSIESTTGNVLWRRGTAVKFFDYSPQTNSVILYETSPMDLRAVFSFRLNEKGEVTILDNTNGNNRFEPIKVKGLNFMQDFGPDFMMATKDGLNRYEYMSGREIWDKSPKGRNFSKVIKTPNNLYLYTANGKMNAVDIDGNQQWKKSIEITDEDDSETLVLDYTNNNIVYVTETDANIVSLQSGEKKWKKDLKLKYDKKRPSVADFDKASKTYFIYNNEKLYKFKETDGSAPDEFAKIKVKREQQIQKLFIADNTVVVSGIGELIGIDQSGNELYNHFYREPGAGLRIAGAIGAFTVGMAADVLANSTVSFDNGMSYSGLFMKQGSAAQVATDMASKLSFLGADKLNKRFKASKTGDSYSYFLDSDNGQRLLVKVNNVNGKEEDKLILSDAKPLYEIDPFTETIFYAKGNNLEVFE